MEENLESKIRREKENKDKTVESEEMRKKKKEKKAHLFLTISNPNDDFEMVQLE